jgi:hypothetical protein
VNDERLYDYKFWKDEYHKLKERHEQFRNEKDKELVVLRAKLLPPGEIEESKWIKFHKRRTTYHRDFGYMVNGSHIQRELDRVSTAIVHLCSSLNKHDIPSVLLRASKDPEYWLIASETRSPWLQKLLSEHNHEMGSVPISYWITRRLITRYVVRYIFDPMLVGLDKEIESLLLRVQASMELRMGKYRNRL